MRAVEPAENGIVASSDGVRIAYEVFGAGDPTIVLLPTSPIVHARQWKAQVPFLSRHYRVVTYDGAPHSFFDRKAADFARESAAAWDEVLAFIDAHSSG